MSKLHRALKEQKKTTQQTELEIYGSLGIPINGQKAVEVENRQSYVYVRLRDNQNEVVQAFNNKVAASYNLPVVLKREGNRYIVLGVNTQRYENNWNNSAPYLPRHGPSHSFPEGGGGDITWIFERQIMPALVYPSTITGSVVNVYGYPFLAQDNTWKYAGNTGTQDILSYRPISGAMSLMALVYLDANTGNPGLLVNSGTYFPQNITGSNIYQYLPVPASHQIPLAGIRLSTGTSSITWPNIYGVRQWVHHRPTGTAGGGGGSTIVVGNPAIPVYHDGQFIITGSAIRADGNVQVSTTGTQIVLNYPVTTYQRFEQPIPLLGVTGTLWKVPDNVYASGSLGVFYNGVMQTKGIHYDEFIWVSGTYRLFFTPATGTYHMVSYGVPCVSQTFVTGGFPTGGLVDSNGVLMNDSNGVQLVDSQGN